MLDFSILVDISSYPWEYFIVSVFVIFSSSVVDTYLIFIGGNGWSNVLVKYCSGLTWLEGLLILI